MKSLIENESSISMIPYSENLRTEWDEFIEHQALNSTFLHSRGFYDHSSQNAENDASFVFLSQKKIIAVFPATSYKLDDNWILNSHLRGTYGGFIVSNNIGIKHAIILVDRVLSFAKQNGINQIIIRNPFRIFQHQPCDETDYAMWYHGFQIKSRELEIAIPLNDNSKKNYHKNTARNVKKATGLVEVRISDDYFEFWNLLEKCLMNKHSKLPTHDYKSILNLRNNVSSNKIILFSAYHHSKLIGGIVVFNVSNLAIHAQYIASDSEFESLCPIHAIIDYLVDWGLERKIKYLNLGMANEDDGRKINYGLFRFKESFGGRGVLRETMIKDLKSYEL